MEMEEGEGKKRKERHVDGVGKQGSVLFNSSMMIYLI
jgi:hypothetical protein